MIDRKFISQILIPASSQALIDISTLETLLNVSTSSFTTVAPLWINSVSQAVQNYTNNPFVVESRYDQLWPFRDGWHGELGRRLQTVQLERYPVLNPPSPSLTAAPAAPTLGYVTGGALAKRKYYVRLSYVTPTGETAAGIEGSITIPANYLISIASPGVDVYSLATSWNVYIGTTSALETQQATGLNLSNSWTEPTTGLVSGAAMPLYPLVV